ncbi:uncharacterized protein LOC121835323 [Ixodes scapularis]|uniref:uncharacterized protein LOC121835323 n=1 Tax=Ixodes scapularis TaxID=6945 RepID=UPI001C383799|nr:uncharacterized protein LOC121835323 [Ixodes scapularis]
MRGGALLLALAWLQQSLGYRPEAADYVQRAPAGPNAGHVQRAPAGASLDFAQRDPARHPADHVQRVAAGPSTGDVQEAPAGLPADYAQRERADYDAREPKPERMLRQQEPRRCRDDVYMDLRAVCEQHLDEIMRLYTKGDHGQSCKRLRQYTSCVGRALNRTHCNRVPELEQRERQRLRANVNDYNWSCSMSKQEYAGSGGCDGRAMINQHMKCGSTFQTTVSSINVYMEGDRACRAVKEYKACVRPIFQSDNCQANQELMDRLLRFSHTVLKEFSSACSNDRKDAGVYQDAPPLRRDAQPEDDEETPNRVCRFEQLRQKVLLCQKEGYSIIRTRDAHAKTDICEELRVFRDCAVGALKGTHCAKEKSARQFVVTTIRESFSRFGIECTGLWNSATRSSIGDLTRVVLALSLSAMLLRRA